MVGKCPAVPANPNIQPAELPARLRAIPGFEALQTAARSLPAYLVGGTVRDLLLGASTADLDVVVEGELRPLAEALGGEVTEHERFQTATVRLPEGTIDLAQARAESYERPGALPTVRPASLADDLGRRDFGFNAIAVALEDPDRLIDPHGGIGDLGHGRVRVLHEGSFRDDPTRALRAARYAARFGFELEARTAELLRETDLTNVSDDRVAAELRKLAAEADPGAAFALLRDWGLLSEIPPDGPGRASTVAELASAPPWAGWIDRAEAVLVAVAEPPPRAVELALAAPERPSQAVALARGAHPAELITARAMGAEWLDRYAAEWRQVRLEIDGGDLLAAGVPEGPAIGRALEAALSAKLDGELSDRGAELELALKVARGEIPGD
jgi:tRNA nucleotidyltransferase (CCA-adding enzyme)